jgi:soluble lytic murein transglycosylase-like protein
MMTKRAWKTSAAMMMLVAFSFAAMANDRASADLEDSGLPPVRLESAGPSSRGELASSEEVGFPVPNAAISSPKSDRDEGPAPAIPAAQVDRGASFLRAHVARRMARFAGHDSDEVAEAILAASRRADIDPLLLLAIIEVESAFDPLARSNRNALGLMQVKPATLWREVERSGLVGDDPHDPELNVAAGALYFRRVVNAFGANDVALMAYNAGPNRILGLIRAGSIPDRFLEYPRRVRAAETRLRRALAVDSAGAALARNGLGPVIARAE